MSSGEITVNRKVFDGACVFAGVTVLQCLVPSPLDYFLLPAAATYWFIQSGQDSWVIDSAYHHARSALHAAQDWYQVQSTLKKMCEPPLVDKPEDQDDE